jgi:hypothetical protein
LTSWSDDEMKKPGEFSEFSSDDHLPMMFEIYKKVMSSAALNGGFEALSSQINSIDKKVDLVDQKVDKVEETQMRQGEALENINDRLYNPDTGLYTKVRDADQLRLTMREIQAEDKRTSEENDDRLHRVEQDVAAAVRVTSFIKWAASAMLLAVLTGGVALVYDFVEKHIIFH